MTEAERQAREMLSDAKAQQGGGGLTWSDASVIAVLESLLAERVALERDGRELHAMLSRITLALNDAGWPSSALGVEDRAVSAIRTVGQREPVQMHKGPNSRIGKLEAGLREACDEWERWMNDGASTNDRLPDGTLPEHPRIAELRKLLP